jgi:branched-chain amino acid transport system substrate-binding protein
MSHRLISSCLVGVSLLVASAAGHAEIVIGAILAETGPGASLGIPYKNALMIAKGKFGDEPVRIVVLNDGSDPTTAVKGARKLVAEDKVDVIIGPSNTPQTLAVVEFANELKTPLLTLAPITIPQGKQEWVFVVPQSVALMVGGVVEHMKSHGVKTAAYIGFSDAWGDSVGHEFKRAAEAAGIQVVGEERYARADTSVTAQVLRTIARQPDAVMVGGSGTPGALPHIALTQQGYKGLQYDNHGGVSQDFIRVGTKNVAGTIAPTGPLVVNGQLPATHPLKAIGEEFTRRYESKYGLGSANPFAGYASDAFLLIETAAPAALRKAKPGTPEFRAALREALEQVRSLHGTEATYTISPSDHYGAKDDARVMVQVVDGAWTLVKP